MRTRAVIAWALTALVIANVALAAWVETLPGWEGVRSSVPGAALAAGWAMTGALLITVRPANTVGWLLLLSGVLQGWANFGTVYGGYGVGVADPMWPLADWVAQSAIMSWFPSIVLPVTAILGFYPDGRLPSARWRVPVVAVATGLTVFTVAPSLAGSGYNDVAPGDPPLQVPAGWWGAPIMVTAAILLLGGLLAIWVMSGFRLARARPPLRPQLAWYFATVVPFFLIIFTPLPEWVLITAGFMIPVAIAVGVMRYRMLDIVLRPVLVYGLLTLVVVAVFVGVTVLAGTAVEGVQLPGVLAASLVAVGLMPARERLQRGTDRFVYGDRGDPMRAITAFGDRVASAPEDALFAELLASVSGAVRASGARVTDPSGRVLAAHGEMSGEALSLPLVVAGREVGTLEVAPRPGGGAYSAADRRVLSALAPQVAVLVRVAQEARGRERFEQELKVAQVIQQQFLPTSLPDLADWHVSAFYQPARTVGGDFYDVIELPDGRVMVVTGDVTDKGIPAALVMASTHALLREAGPRLGSPAAVLSRVNEILCADIPAYMFVTCLVLVVDLATGEVVLANAGHNLPYLRCAGGARELRATGMPLGLMPGSRYDEVRESIGAGEVVLLYSDGLTEQHDSSGEMFGFGRTGELVAGADTGSALVDACVAELERFSGAQEQEDDITLVTLQRGQAEPTSTVVGAEHHRPRDAALVGGT